jgi:hypothetical protein
VKIAIVLALAIAVAAFAGFITIRVTDEPYCDQEPEATEMALREFADRCLSTSGDEAG